LVVDQPVSQVPLLSKSQRTSRALVAVSVSETLEASTVISRAPVTNATKLAWGASFQTKRLRVSEMPRPPKLSVA